MSVSFLANFESRLSHLSHISVCYKLSLKHNYYKLLFLLDVLIL